MRLAKPIRGLDSAIQDATEFVDMIRAIDQQSCGLDGAFADVLEFHHRFAPSIVAPLPHVPTDLDNHRYCFGFMDEELCEVRDAMLAGNIPLVADGLVDLIYVAIRAALVWGIDLRPAWVAVHAVNMAKEGGETRADGKVMKPPGWKPANLAAILQAQEPIEI